MEYSEESKMISKSVFFHHGISVSDVDIVCDFFERVFGLKTIQKREIEHPYINSLVGGANLSAKVAMIQIDSTSFLEVLSWQGRKQSQGLKHFESQNVYDIGAQHLCFFSEDIEKLYSVISLETEVELISDGIVKVQAGPNIGARVFFVRIFGFLFLEIFQKN